MRHVLLGVLVVVGCGRIGFERISQDQQRDAARSAPRMDAGIDAAFDAAVMPASDAGAGLPMARMDASAAPLPMDASRPDATVMPARDAGDASAPLASDDAGADEDAGTPVVVPPPGTFCEDVPQLAAAPVIDGRLEPGLSLRRVEPVGWTASVPLPAEHAADYALGWRPDGVYAFVHVHDTSRDAVTATPNLFCGDSIELYLDSDGAFPSAPSYDKPGAQQFVIAAPANATTPVSLGEKWDNGGNRANWTSTGFEAFPTADGYVVEAFVVAADLGLSSWTLSSGGRIGVALGINLSRQTSDPAADCGVRLGQYFNRVASAVPALGCNSVGPFCAVDAFCVAPLQP
jgi:hypothetical protein